MDEIFGELEKIISLIEEQTQELEIANFMLGVEVDELTKQVDAFLGRISE